MIMTSQQLQFFDIFGFLKFPGIFSEEIQQITDEFENVVRLSGTNHDYKQRSTIDPFADINDYLSQLIDDPRIDSVVSSILGADYNYAGSDGSYYVGDTLWHSDHHPDAPYNSLKIAFYLDNVFDDSGCLRVIPGSCHWKDKYTMALDKIFPVQADNNTQQVFGITGDQLPAHAVTSEPGDMLLFNHKTKHSSWGGGNMRRMFTYNFEQRFPDQIITELETLIKPRLLPGKSSPYGANMLATAGSDRMIHLEQRIQISSHLNRTNIPTD